MARVTPGYRALLLMLVLIAVFAVPRTSASMTTNAFVALTGARAPQARLSTTPTTDVGERDHMIFVPMSSTARPMLYPAPTPSPAPSSAPTIVNGDDWWLPAYVQRTVNSGLYDDQYGTHPAIGVKLVNLTWKEISPREGVYDWSKLDNALATYGANGVWLRIYASDAIHTPSWLAAKYPNMRTMRWFQGGYFDGIGGTSSGDFWPLWHTGYHTEFRALLQSFRARNYGNNPKLKFIYMPAAWRWNEFGCYFVAQMKADGMTPETYMTWFKGHVEDWIGMVGEGNRHKLVFTAEDNNQWCEENGTGNAAWSQSIGRGMTAYTTSRGLSARNGMTEQFNYVVTDVPNWGTRVVTSGSGKYMVTDDTAPLLADPNKIFAGENECYNGCGFSVPANAMYYHVKMANLKALQLRMNWLFIDEETAAPYAPFVDYVIKTLGKRVTDSPDAWVALREGNDAYYGSNQWIRNWERWLIQREVGPNGYTVRTHPVTSSMPYNGTSYEARRTDHARGSDYIYFGVDDTFIRGGSQPILIKVTYLDNTTSRWWVEYDAGDGKAYNQTAAVTNRGDGQWKTVTFPIADAAFANRQNGGMDFRIYNGGISDLSVQFVRVIKAGNP